MDDIKERPNATSNILSYSITNQKGRGLQSRTLQRKRNQRRNQPIKFRGFGIKLKRKQRGKGVNKPIKFSGFGFDIRRKLKRKRSRRVR